MHQAIYFSYNDSTYCYTTILVKFDYILQALSCLVQLASIRRSLFNNNERAKFLEQLVQGVKGILESPQVCFLDDHELVCPLVFCKSIIC